MRPSSSSPLSGDELLRLAKAYLARRAASSLQLRRYLMRKARQRSDRENATPNIESLIDDVLLRIGRAGLLDDAAIGEARASGLIRKGLAVRQVRRTLHNQGLAAPAVVDAVDDEDQARRYAERKRLGPFAFGRRAASPERDIRAMVRAGFDANLAIKVLRTIESEAERRTEAEPDVNGA